MKAVALLAVAAVLCAVAVNGAILRDDAVEWSVDGAQTAFWSKQSVGGTPVLLTFASSTPVLSVLKELASQLHGAHGASCRFVERDTNIAVAPVNDFGTDVDSDVTRPVGPLLTKYADALTLHCGAATGATLTRDLISFVPPAIPSADRKWLGSSEYPNNPVDLVADSLAGLLHWAVEFLAVHFGPVHAFQAWNTTGASGRFNLNTGAPISIDTPGLLAFGSDNTSASDPVVRLALTADWGSGTRESAYVANLLVEGYEPHWTVHIGDVYYLGSPADFDSNVFGIAPAGVANGVTWPHGSLGSWGICGNHEMYSRGFAYYDHFLPTLGTAVGGGGSGGSALAGQKASFFSLENDYWRVISLDTGYNTYSPLLDNNNNPQPQQVIDWLINDVRIDDPSDTRGIVFFSHHQTFSAFESTKYTATPTQIAALLPANRTVLWLWGHEHRLSFYDLVSNPDGVSPLSVYGRCVGNGGYPTSIAEAPKHVAGTNLRAYDDRVYTVLDGFTERQIGFQGFQHLNFTGPVLTIDYKSLKFEADGKTPSFTDSDLMVTESWGTDASGNVVRESFTIVNSNMTIVTSN